MDLSTTLVTGGAGFIGSHIAESLISVSEGCIRILDNLSNGSIENLDNIVQNPRIQFIQGDLKDHTTLKNAVAGIDTVFHMAAYPEVRTGFEKPWLSYEENTSNTFRLLEEIRKSKADNIIFASSSTIYGEPEVIPTPESYGPLVPISPYGASKLACEALISSYCHTYGIGGKIFRLANVIGARSRHGVLWDFINKLKKNSKNLEILGDGQQSKSYIHISDFVNCIFMVLDKTRKDFDIFNVGNDDKTDVLSIAKATCEAMNLSTVRFDLQKENNDGRGWNGDVKTMLLDISKLKKLAWSPSLSSIDAVKSTCQELVNGLDRSSYVLQKD